MTCAQALSNFDDKKVEEALKEAIGDSDARIQDEAIKGLAKYKDAALAPLLEQLYNSQKNYFVRAAAVKALASIEGEKATPIIEDALTQDSYEQVIKIAALNSLVMIDSSKAYDEAVEFTKYGEPQPLRLQGMNEMVRLKPKSEETLNLLKKYLNDPYIWARMVAINSLGRVGDKSIVPLLQDREKAETDGRLQQAARRAIESINKRESRGSE